LIMFFRRLRPSSTYSLTLSKACSTWS
jgi:hypothetical protein